MEESLSYRPDIDRYPAASPEMTTGVFPFGFNLMQHGVAHCCRRGLGKEKENIGTNKQGKNGTNKVLASACTCRYPHEAQKTVLDQTEYSHDINWMG